VTMRNPVGKRARSAAAPRVGLFGHLGASNIGNDASAAWVGGSGVQRSKQSMSSTSSSPRCPLRPLRQANCDAPRENTNPLAGRSARRRDADHNV